MKQWWKTKPSLRWYIKKWVFKIWIFNKNGKFLKVFVLVISGSLSSELTETMLECRELCFTSNWGFSCGVHASIIWPRLVDNFWSTLPDLPSNFTYILYLFTTHYMNVKKSGTIFAFFKNLSSYFSNGLGFGWLNMEKLILEWVICDHPHLIRKKSTLVHLPLTSPGWEKVTFWPFR